MRAVPRMRAIVKAARAAARSGVNDADVVGAPAARATAHAIADFGDGADRAELRHQPVQVEPHHALACDAYRVQFEMRGKVGESLHTG